MPDDDLQVLVVGLLGRPRGFARDWGPLRCEEGVDSIAAFAGCWNGSFLWSSVRPRRQTAGQEDGCPLVRDRRFTVHHRSVEPELVL